MAEYQQRMKDWQRMCDSMQGGIRKCDNCPLLKVLCQYKPNEKVDFAEAEQIIEKWVDEHPVVYPRRDSMSEKITLVMSREQAQAVMDATELLARLEIGQFEEITWKMLDHFRGKDRNGKPTFDGTSRDLANAYLKCACLAVFGVKNGWPDVGEKNMQHHRCWAVYAAIRYALAWHDHPEGGDTVDFGEPLGYGEPLPKCEVKEG